MRDFKGTQKHHIETPLDLELMQASSYTQINPQRSMEEIKELMLHGMWASPFSLEVEVALKIKGVSHEYKEENLEEKSESLLQFNPIHKKVPVLVHHGKPIAESLVILEYIEDVWKEPPLLPKDPYTRATVRFWVDFFYQKFLHSCRSIIVTQGEEQEKATKKCKEYLRTLEGGIGEAFSTDDGPFFNGAKPGLLDIVVGSISCWLKVIGELTGGEELVDKERMPRICSCIAAFCELKVMKDSQPNHEKLVTYAQGLRMKIFAPARA